MINNLSIKKNLAKTVEVLIPDLLYTLDSGRPAIILSGQGANKPPFPYAVVSYIATRKEGRSHTSRYMNETDNLVYETDYTMVYSVTIHDDASGDASGIANYLKDMLTTEVGLNALESNTGAFLLRINNPSFSSLYLNAKYEEVARINIELSVRQVITDTSAGVIEQVTVEGEIYDSFDDDTPATTITTTAP